MVEWRKDVVHTCYGCEMYCPANHAEIGRQGTSVCLCSKCANVLFNILKEKGGAE